MSNPSKQRGTAWETAVVAYLNECGVPCERRALSGNRDRGDVAGIAGWVLELKAAKRIELGTWLTEAAVEATNADTRNYAVVAKRRQRNVADAFVVMPLSVFAELVRDGQHTAYAPAVGRWLS